MRTIVPLPARPVDELEVGLVHESGRLERSTVRPPGELPVSDRAELLVQKRDEPVERVATAAPQLGYDCRGLRRRAHLLRETAWPGGAHAPDRRDVGFRRDSSCIPEKVVRQDKVGPPVPTRQRGSPKPQGDAHASRTDAVSIDSPGSA